MNFREQRLALGLSQKQLAKRMDTTPNTISRWERGEPPISGPAKQLLDLLVRIQRLADKVGEDENEQS